MRILYVEDNSYLRETIGLLLEADGRDITSVDSGEAAVEAMDAAVFDLIVTDVSLPGMSGLDLARHARKVAPKIWIVLMSGYAFTSGLDEFGPHSAALAKPFDPDELDALMARIEKEVGTDSGSADA